MQDLERTAHVWASEPSAAPNYFTFPPTMAYACASITGSAGDAATLLQWVLRKALPGLPARNVLSLCCGHGVKDRQLARLGAFETLLGIDVSEPAIVEARKAAQQSGLAERMRYA